MLLIFNVNTALGVDLMNTATQDLNTVGQQGFAQEAGESAQLPIIVGRVISIVLGVLGVLLVVYIILGGFKYMMSKGDPNEAKKGTAMIVNATIGLVITLAAYAIATFVISRLAYATGTAIQ